MRPPSSDPVPLHWLLRLLSLRLDSIILLTNQGSKQPFEERVLRSDVKPIPIIIIQR
jgi:hypothetical protein